MLIHFSRYFCAGLSINLHSKDGFPVQKRMVRRLPKWKGIRKQKAKLLGAAEKSDPTGESTKNEYANYEYGVLVSEYLKGTNPKERSGH